MKILSAAQVREADQYTIEHEPISSLELMERASQKFVSRFVLDYPSPRIIKVFCGPGNNGGDGLAIARLLQQDDYRVKVYYLASGSSYSPDFLANLEKLKVLMPEYLQPILDEADLPEINDKDVVIDALFGSGLNKPLAGLAARIVDYVNRSAAAVASVDIPSGMFADKPSESPIVVADKVYTFQTPKLSLLLPQYAIFGERWDALDIRLHPDYMEKVDTPYEVIDYAVVHPFYKTRRRISHKGNYGHALILAGSFGKMGAAILAASASLRAGAGLVTAHIPSAGYHSFQVSVLEAMCTVDEEKHLLSALPDLKPYSAIGIGPGIGLHKKTRKLLSQLIKKYHHPMVLDADALNFLSEEPDGLLQLPCNSILTPHVGEFRRLAGEWQGDFERLEVLRKFSKKYKVIVVLKDAFTAVADPSGKVYFNITGNSGMATGGSGDVLTGVITGLLAQGYAPLEAAVLGVYVHGLAGNAALESQSKESLIASDIIAYLGEAFKLIRHT
jgi:ADP-dependent NAD(P)H-hydrate dehydratase / NAD(P)H-hydrate epimerase